MHTTAQLERFQSAAQCLIDGQPFGPVRAQIEDGAAHTVDVWQEARNRKMPVASAIGHVCGMQAIEIIQSGNLPFEIPPDASPYEQYAALTSDIDLVAGIAAIVHIDDIGPGFAAAFDYYAHQVDIIRKFEADHSTTITRRGKVSGKITATPGDILIKQQTANALGNTASLIVREAIRICREEGEVPENESLTQKLIARIGQLEQITSLPGQVFFRLVNGDELARRRHAALQTANPIDIPSWYHILQQKAESGELHKFVPLLIKPIATRTIEEEVAKIDSTRKFGNCAAQLTLRPYEKPGRPEANRALANAYFASHGIKLPYGAFKLITYQLLRGIEIGQQTIFADRDTRAALLAIARSADM